MNIKKNIPNAITCCNLLCGCLAIVQAFEGNLVWAAYLVGLAAIFDFFDGFAARLLRVTSPIGKDLDSLADMVTFGVVPGIVMFKMIDFAFLWEHAVEEFDASGNATLVIQEEFTGAKFIISSLAFVIVIFSAIRLAKFNNDTRQTTSFIGLPTPANAIFICSIPLILKYECVGLHLNSYVLIITSVILSALLVSEIPLFALKFKFFGWKGNRVRYVFLGLSLILLITLQFIGIPLIIILYVLMSLITNAYLKRKTAS